MQFLNWAALIVNVMHRLLAVVLYLAVVARRIIIILWQRHDRSLHDNSVLLLQRHSDGFLSYVLFYHRESNFRVFYLLITNRFFRPFLLAL